MDLIETVNAHRKMWEWIASNIMTIKPRTINEIKKIYFTDVLNLSLDSVLNLCYICDYFGDCDNCMLCNCFESNSIYNRVVECVYNGDYKKASNLSYNMAMLPINSVTLIEESTKEKAILEHIKMWNWIADNVIQIKPPTATNIKKLYLQTCNINVDLVRNDFICEYVNNNYNGDCHFCPIRWGASYFSICSEEECGTFQYCLDNMLYKDASYIAKVIAQLPTKE